MVTLTTTLLPAVNVFTRAFDRPYVPNGICAGDVSTSIAINAANINISLTIPLGSIFRIHANFSFAPHIRTAVGFTIRINSRGRDRRIRTRGFGHLTSVLRRCANAEMKGDVSVINAPAVGGFGLLMSIRPFHGGG